MGMADDIRNLAQDIANSYDARIEWIASLRSETIKMLEGFRKEHKKLATEWQKLVMTMQRKRRQVKTGAEW